MAAVDVEDSSCGKDGPVLTMMNKRLRALKKKLNRIAQLEAAKNEGKSINKEQEDVLRSKVQVTALIEEYGRLREPLLVAVKEEIAEKEREWSAAAAAKEEQVFIDDKDGGASNESLEEARTESEVTVENAGEVESGGADAGGGGDAAPAAPGGAAGAEEIRSVGALDETLMLEMIQLLYFALLFDVRPLNEVMRTIKYHERVSCLSYDFVTDESTSPLNEADLNALALFGSLVTSRSPETTLSHREALQCCMGHARQWLLNSDAVIEDNSLNLTYAELRERLNRILATEYYTMTPELQTVTSGVTECGVFQELVNGHITGNISDSSGTNPDISQLDVNQTKASEPQQAVEDQQQLDDNQTANPRQHQQGFPQKFRNRGGGGAGGGGGANYGRGRGRGDGSSYGRGGRGGRGDGRGYRGGGYPSNGNRGGGNAGNGGGQYYDQSGYYQRSGYFGRRGGRGGYYSNSGNNARTTQTGRRLRQWRVDHETKI